MALARLEFFFFLPGLKFTLPLGKESSSKKDNRDFCCS